MTAVGGSAARDALRHCDVSNTRLSQCTAVCRVRCPSTLPTVALQSQTLLADTTYARPVDITYQYHITGLDTFGRRAFSIAGLMVWNSLPDSLRDPALSSSNFSQLLKMDFFNRYSAHSTPALITFDQDGWLACCLISIFVYLQ